MIQPTRANVSFARFGRSYQEEKGAERFIAPNPASPSDPHQSAANTADSGPTGLWDFFRSGSKKGLNYTVH
jgi:hypothetical protein